MDTMRIDGLLPANKAARPTFEAFYKRNDENAKPAGVFARSHTDLIQDSPRSSREVKCLVRILTGLDIAFGVSPSRRSRR